MKTQRTAELEKLCAARGQSKPLSHFFEDYHSSALTRFVTLSEDIQNEIISRMRHTG